MAKTLSYMLPLGTPAPGFNLPDFNNTHYSLDDFKDAPALLVAFICCHCPYVKHVIDEFAKMANAYKEKGAAIVTINANDIVQYPQDGPVHMARDAERYGFTFPYLLDETQQVAKSYKAVCTPDFFLFDKDRRLAYRGQMDDSRPENNQPVTGADLKAAMDALLEGQPVTDNQLPSLGCNIKWKPGNSPDDD
jgi:peroxiredoxin